MSNFVIGVGGSGSKYIQSLIHLGAAGLLPVGGRDLDALIVDPDENNGNLQDCKEVERAFQNCKSQLRLGECELFSADIALGGPWTPLGSEPDASLASTFHYDRLINSDSVEVDLMRLLFEPEEIEMPLKQGFRGRPAIGAAVMAHAVDFNTGIWDDLKKRLGSRGTKGSVNLMLAGSVFGGSGAAGVPTLCRLLQESLESTVPELRIGLVLFLPFFQFKPVAGQRVQADPAAFPMATAEALKYYDERQFLTICDSIFVIGEETPAEMSVSAVGAAEQRNEAHFVELVAGMGTMRFFDSKTPGDQEGLNVAARAQDGTLTWRDLPYPHVYREKQAAKLQHMVIFAVAYHYLFYPRIVEILNGRKADAFWNDHIGEAKLETAGKALNDLDNYIHRFLTWFLQLSNPRRGEFRSGLVNPTVFGEKTDTGWRVKALKEFQPAQMGTLIQNPAARVNADADSVFKRANSIKVAEPAVVGASRVVRALYDACALQ